MISRLIKTALATCLVMAGMTAQSFSLERQLAQQLRAEWWSIPTAPPGMVPMVVYVPAQQMQPTAIPPHTHAPQAAQTIDATHCSINDVAVLTQDVPSCEKAGGTVVKERASFGYSKCHGSYWHCLTH